MKFIIKKPFLNYKVDDIIDVKTNSNGIPYDRFFRNRLRDSKVDGCIAPFEIDNVQSTKLKNKKLNMQESIGNADIST